MKFEARNPKSETNSNDQKQLNVPNKLDLDSSFWIFPGLEFILAPICFEFRASDFGFVSPGAWRDNIFCHFSLEHKMLETNSQTSERKNFLRGYKVILDSDLADLYQVEVKQLKRQVRRNQDRFPADFMFALTKQENESLRRQIGTLKRGEHAKYLPYAFTEQGVAMLSSVLNSERAVQVNIEIMRAFVQLRQLLASNSQLARKLDALEKKYDAQFKVVFDAIRQLMTPPQSKTRRIGFVVDEKPARYGRPRRLRA